MAKRVQYRRLIMLALLLLLALAGLGYRLVDLQVLRHEELSAKAQQNTQQEIRLEPRRGDILDAKGNLLASSVFVKTVCADPTLLGDRQAEVSRALAPLLQMNEAQVMQKLTPRVRQNESGETVPIRSVRLKQKVSLETWQKIQSAMTNIACGLELKKLPRSEQAFYAELRTKAIFTEPIDDQLRVYPNQTLAAHVLGYVGLQESQTNGKPVVDTVGIDGIERSMDAKLRGIRGWRVTERDRSRREMVTFREQNVEPQDGFNVVLTIDSVIQHIMETALVDAMDKHSPISISGIVVRPRTGEILAMATLPTFDPNNPGAVPADARRNRVIADIAEPGSTFKIVVISGALNDGTVKVTDVYNCEHGRFIFAGRPLHDHEPYDDLTVEGIITKSSNIGAAKVGIKMGETRLYDYIRDFGFGSRTGLPLPGEVPGIVHPVRNWSKVSIAQIPMGQGIATTRLQMMMAMCAIANNGVLMRPMLVARLEDAQHNVVASYPPQRVRQIMSESTARLMVKALKTVASTNGTAPKAALEHYTVAGKTGTAQKAEHGMYVPGKYFSSFIGFFPADNPELCISVTMDEPKQGYFGGQTAAPVFKQIAERAANYLNIRPEDGDLPSAPDTVAAPADTRPLRTAARSQ
jgi:cell division protein FtsI/penicillin-binding protein 2